MDDEMKRELNALKTEVATFKRDTEGRFDRLEGVLRRVAVNVTNLIGLVGDLKRTSATKQDIGRLNARIDHAAIEVESSRRERAFSGEAFKSHQKQLEDHAKRLLRLETRVS